MGTLGNKTNVLYIDTKDEGATDRFTDAFHGILEEYAGDSREIVILCIGTDRATGDSLGPLVGYKLDSLLMGEQEDEAYAFENIYVYGTLELPVHARNIDAAVERIADEHENPLIVAVDASLGKSEHVGCLTLGVGAIRPGAGLNKNLPHVGDIFVTGIVNYTGAMDMIILQNTRLGVVMKMADVVTDGIINGLKRLHGVKAAG